MLKKIFILMLCLLMTACGSKSVMHDGPEITGHMQLDYAERFSVDHCADGSELIHIAGEDFLLLPENSDISEYPDNVTVLRAPLDNIYLAATSAFDLFDAIGAADSIKMTSTDIDGWSLPAAKTAISGGKMKYVGKYSAPDYELLAESGCDIAIESTMINHSPQTKEQLQRLGIPVLTEQSSYEAHPMARLEWIKLYGLLTGKGREAEEYFAAQKSAFEALTADDIPEDEKKTAAFFYVNPNGYVNIRKPGDYVSKMIELAGGKYIFSADKLNIEENALSTMNIQTEEFYNTAKDADVLIYSGTIESAPENMEQFLSLSPVFADFRAVKNANVWCTGRDMFQQTTGVSETIEDLHRIFSGKADGVEQLTFLRRLK